MKMDTSFGFLNKDANKARPNSSMTINSKLKILLLFLNLSNKLSILLFNLNSYIVRNKYIFSI